VEGIWPVKNLSLIPNFSFGTSKRRKQRGPVNSCSLKQEEKNRKMKSETKSIGQIALLLYLFATFFYQLAIG